MAHDTIRSGCVDMASVHRTGSVGIDLPAGASADALRADDYRTIELEEVGVGELFLDMAAVDRADEMGVDLPPGAGADDLAPEDYRPFRVERRPGGVASA